MKLLNFVELVVEKVKMNIRSEVRKSYLSYVWWIIEPALMVSVFYVVFGILLRRGGPNFMSFLLCGYIPFQWFARSTQNSMVSISNSKGLINQIKIPKVFFPMVTMFHDAFKAMIVFSLLLVFLIIFGITPTFYWLYMIPIMLVQFLFIATCGVFVAMIIPFAKDLKFLVATSISLVMFSSGVFYDYKIRILPEHQIIFLVNPMANFLSNYREVLLYAQPPNWSALLLIAGISGAILTILLSMLWRMDGVYPRLVIE